MFENVSKESIQKDLERIPKRQNISETIAEIEFRKLCDKLKKEIQKKQQRDEYICK